MTSPHGSSGPDTEPATGTGSSADRAAESDQAATAPNPSMLARWSAPDDGSAAEHAIDTALQGLRGLDDLPVADHVHRFDTVHTALTEALGRTENHQSEPHDGS